MRQNCCVCRWRAMRCSKHSGWADQGKVHSLIPGVARGGTEPTPPAATSTALQGLGGSGRGGGKPANTMENDWLTPGQTQSWRLTGEWKTKTLPCCLGRTAQSQRVHTAASTRTKGWHCREQREAYLQTLILISLALEFSLFESTSLWFVFLENQDSRSSGLLPWGCTAKAGQHQLKLLSWLRVPWQIPYSCCRQKQQLISSW